MSGNHINTKDYMEELRMKLLLGIITSVMLYLRIDYLRHRKSRWRNHLDTFKFVENYDDWEKNIMAKIFMLYGSILMAYYVSMMFILPGMVLKALSILQVLCIYPLFFSPNTVSLDGALCNRTFNNFTNFLDVVYYTSAIVVFIIF